MTSNVCAFWALTGKCGMAMCQWTHSVEHQNLLSYRNYCAYCLCGACVSPLPQYTHTRKYYGVLRDNYKMVCHLRQNNSKEWQFVARYTPVDFCRNIIWSNNTTNTNVDLPAELIAVMRDRHTTDTPQEANYVVKTEDISVNSKVETKPTVVFSTPVDDSLYEKHSYNSEDYIPLESKHHSVFGRDHVHIPRVPTSERKRKHSSISNSRCEQQVMPQPQPQVMPQLQPQVMPQPQPQVMPQLQPLVMPQPQPLAFPIHLLMGPQMIPIPVHPSLHEMAHTIAQMSIFMWTSRSPVGANSQDSNTENFLDSP